VNLDNEFRVRTLMLSLGMWFLC